MPEFTCAFEFIWQELLQVQPSLLQCFDCASHSCLGFCCRSASLVILEKSYAYLIEFRHGCHRVIGCHGVSDISSGDSFKHQPQVFNRSRHWAHYPHHRERTDRRRKVPVAGIRPGVGLSPQIPEKCAGTRIEPPPSLPMPAADIPDAMAAASPPLEPPGVQSRSQGLLVRPCNKFSVSYAINISAAFVLPRMMAPAFFSRCTSVASLAAT